ncbi:helix-turn-helix domain-containing protein [Bdellovibrio sp. HCB288]|uniref:helix-turn-helix domain-containing protein n=1 Tax=Bdellovibrio sp. HCB288 TaxID=3394355 RepID=UPI0039B3D20F
MGEKKLDSDPKKLRRYLTPEEFQANIVDWSRKTLERRIQDEGFPAIRDGNSWLIPVDKIDSWFKRREK